MRENTLYHNPNCSKSRAALELINQKNLNVKVREYLNNPPTKEELEFICEYLKISPIKIIRTNEKLFNELEFSTNDNLTNDQWFSIISNHPILMERPILIYNQKVAIGRPIENILNIIS